MAAIKLLIAEHLQEAGCRAFFSDRHGGVSGPPYATLNLALHVGDEQGSVRENRRRWEAACGVNQRSIVWADQVHGNSVYCAGENDRGRHTPVGEFDALITGAADLALSVFIADCLPILLCDPVSKSIAAVHAGRGGSFLNIAVQAVSAMQQHFGSRPENIRAALGPSARVCCYEIDGPVIAELQRRHPRGWEHFLGPARAGPHAFLDLPKLNCHQLQQAGLRADRIRSYGGCTICNQDYFSYRREKVTGRMAATISL